jgi:L-lactate dehydrogenase complex protein LldG
MLELFASYASAAGAKITTVTIAEAPQVIVAIASEAVSTVKCTAALRDSYPALFQEVERALGPVVVAEEVADAGHDPSALASALAGGTGIVVARAGIAETGSLVLADDALAPRLLSMLADVCIALLPVSSMLPGLDEAAALLDELTRSGHRYVSLVTGPSRTADIERVLTIGVQGPKVLHIILITEEGS